jgi:hypothetical protein
MQTSLVRKGLVIGIIVLFVGVGVVPSISGNIVEKKARMKEASEAYEPIYGDILFSDDFNDNKKNLSKWTEIYTSGTWEETNGRAEFQLVESGGAGARSEGIESTGIQAMVGGDEPWDNKLTVTWKMFADIGSTSLEGEVTLRITDGKNWIEMEYDRLDGVARYSDSNGNGDEFVGGDEPWDNKLEIFVDKYEVTMNSSSATVHDSIFADGVSTFNVQIYIELAGSSRTLFQYSAFDDIMIEGVAGCCFPAGTKITMADGSYKNIEDVKLGDRVLSYDIKHDRFTSWTVKMLGNPVHPVYEINDGLIRATKEHPLYIKKTDERIGWGAVNPSNDVVRLREDVLPLEVGDQLLTSEGEWVEVAKITFNSEPVQTYNILSFLGRRTYFANSILVYEEHPPMSYMIKWHLEKLFEQHPHMFPIFRTLLGL